MKYCIKCGNNIDDTALFCPFCGANQKPANREGMTITTGNVLLIIVACFIFIFIISSIINSNKNDSNKPQTNNDQTLPRTEQKTTSEENEPLIIYDYDTSDYTSIHADVLYEYADLFIGEKVITVVTVSSTTSSSIKAHVSNDDSYSYQYIFEFDNPEYNIKHIKENDLYTIAGTVEKVNGSNHPTIYLRDCVLIGNGEILAALMNSKDQQILNCLEKLEAKKEKEKPIIINEFDTSDYILIDADVLFDYADLFIGEKIITVITVKDNYSDSIKANTSNNDTFTYSYIFEFNNNEYNIKYVHEGEVYTIAGTLEKTSTILHSTVYVTDCVLIGNGELLEYLLETKDQQIADCLERRQEKENEQIASALKEKEEYKSSCETVSYEAIARNPATYKGNHIKVSGTVIQVVEGWFNSVTIRLRDKNNDTWYIKYYRSDDESRILEDDYITCYGECDGVESYTSVLGSQVTLPAIKMEYYD